MSVKTELYCPKCDYVTDWTLKTNPDATIYWACDQCLSKKSVIEPTPKPLYQGLKKVKYQSIKVYYGGMGCIVNEQGTCITCPLHSTVVLCKNTCMWFSLDGRTILCKGVPVAELVEEEGKHK